MPIGYLMALKRKEDGDFFERFGVIAFPQPPEKSVWFHCASVGEVRSLKLITDMIQSDMPELKIIISTTTATGKAEAQKLIKPYHAFLLPLENSLATAHIIDYMNVRALILIDTELWPLFISTVAKHTRLFLLNARLSDRTVKSYIRFSFIFARLLSKFEKIYTKSPVDTERFTAVTGNGDKIVTLGNIKFQNRANAPEQKIFSHLSGHKIFSAASTHPGEDEIIIEAFKNSKSCDRLVIAPRHINRSQEICSLAEKAGLTVSLLSELSEKTDCVVVDRFGALEELYIASAKIFIGGSLDSTGGHNIYEALQFRKTVCMGPNMANFAEIGELAVKYNTASTVKNSAELAAYIDSAEQEADFDGLFNEIDTKQKDIAGVIREVLTSVYSD